MQYVVRARRNDGVVRGTPRGQAEAQAVSDAVGEALPHLSRLVAMGANHEVDVIAADGAGVAGVLAISDSLCDRAGELFSDLFVDPDEREVEEIGVLFVEGAEVYGRRLKMLRPASMVNGAERSELRRQKVARP